MVHTVCQNNAWLDGMGNSGIFKAMKRQWNIMITGSWLEGAILLCKLNLVQIMLSAIKWMCCLFVACFMTLYIKLRTNFIFHCSKTRTTSGCNMFGLWNFKTIQYMQELPIVEWATTGWYEGTARRAILRTRTKNTTK